MAQRNQRSCNNRKLHPRLPLHACEPLEPRLLLSILYVDPASPGPLHDGSSWPTAYPDLQPALLAAQAGDEIRLATGTYKPTSTTDRTQSFRLKSGVSLLGGYPGSSSLTPDTRNPQLCPTLLSGEIGDPTKATDNTYRVLYAKDVDATALLDGLTITDSWGNGAMYNSFSSPTLTNCIFSKNSGSGMYNDYSSPTLRNCTFSENSSSGMYNNYSSPKLTNCTFSENSAKYGFGGGMYNDHSSPTLTDCTFSGNSANLYGVDSGSGGGMHNYCSSPTLTNCTFTGNSAQYNGGAINNAWSSPTVANCTFDKNTAANHGGGMYNGTSSPVLINCTFTQNVATARNGGAIDNSGISSATLTNCTFRGNSAGDSGGAIHNFSGASPKLIGCIFTANSAKYGGAMDIIDIATPSLTNCTFNLNTASECGGAIYIGNSATTLINCTFSGNSAKYGGGMYNFQSSLPTLINCSLAANFAIAGGGVYNSSGSPTLTNCIVWGNSSGIITDDNQSKPTVTYSDIQGGYAGTGNLNVDPLFVFTPAMDGDLRLQFGSPCIDAGNNSAVPPGVTTDLAGGSRLADLPSRPDTGLGNAPIVDMGAFETRPGPMALLTGLNTVLAGDRIPLHASALTEEPGPLIYEWEWTGDGQFDDAVGPDVTLDSAAWSVPARVSVSVRVTDAKSRSDIRSTVIQVMPVIYVDDNAVGAGNGSSWADAYTSLAEALRVVQPPYGIRVAAGTYKPTKTTDRTVSFQLKDNVVIQGGYAGYGAAKPDARDVLAYPTILSGDIGKPGVTTDNSYHVVVGSGTDNTSVLDGFVITAGNANGSPSSYSSGGGMYNASGSPTIRNCIFRGNSSSNCGGGMANDASSPQVSNCAFSNNYAPSGGGMYNVGPSSGLVTNCTFSGNFASTAMALYNDRSSPTITNCIIWGNTNSSSPIGGSGKPTIAYCDIQGRATGTGSISIDPQFLRPPSPGPDGKWATPDDDYGDLRLSPTSPARNAGLNSALPATLTTDLAGNPRIQDGTVDLGAYESPSGDLTLTGSPTDTFLLRLTNSTLEIFRNTTPDQSPPTQSLPFNTLTHLTLQGGHYTLASPLPNLNLSLETDTQVRLTTPQHLSSLTLAPTATLDVADQALIVSATPATQQSLLSTLSAAIKSARGPDATWLHSGVGSSAAHEHPHTTLSILLNEKNGKPILTTFAGQPVTENDILVKYTWAGDLNLDGTVDAADYFLIDSGFITQQGTCQHGDLNFDGAVDAADYFLIDSAFIAQTSVLAAETVTVPKVPAPRPQPAPSVLKGLFSIGPVL